MLQDTGENVEGDGYDHDQGDEHGQVVQHQTFLQQTTAKKCRGETFKRFSVQFYNKEGDSEEDNFADEDGLESIVFGNTAFILDIPVESQEPVDLSEDDAKVEGESDEVKEKMDDWAEDIGVKKEDVKSCQNVGDCHQCPVTEIVEFEDMDRFEGMFVFTVDLLDDSGIEKSVETVGEDVVGQRLERLSL